MNVVKEGGAAPESGTLNLYCTEVIEVHCHGATSPE